MHSSPAEQDVPPRGARVSCPGSRSVGVIIGKLFPGWAQTKLARTHSD